MEEGLTGLVPVPVGVHDLIPAEPAEGAGEVEVLQGRPEVLAIPVVDEAADKGLLEPAGERLVEAGSSPPTTPWATGQTPCSRSLGAAPNQKLAQGAPLVVQWLIICLPTQGTRVRALVREDPTCRRATKPACHNY